MTVLCKRTIKPPLNPSRECLKNREIALIIQSDAVTFLWNDPEIQEMAEELGTPVFRNPRPCG